MYVVCLCIYIYDRMSTHWRPLTPATGSVASVFLSVNSELELCLELAKQQNIGLEWSGQAIFKQFSQHSPVKLHTATPLYFPGREASPQSPQTP